MIATYGLEGYTGLRVMPAEMAERHEWLWTVEHTPRDEDKSDMQRLTEAARQ